MTIKQAAEDLRQMANAQGGSRLLLWAADTLEELAKGLAKAEYQTDCMHCKHRGDADNSDACTACDLDCTLCKAPCKCHSCKAGSNWEWMVEYDETGCGVSKRAIPVATIEAAPAVDAVPVVRCRECKHWGTGHCAETDAVKVCEYAKYMVGGNGYCVYGEKMDGKDKKAPINPESCLYYTETPYGGCCLGTKEIDPCKGERCASFKLKMDGGAEDATDP